MTPFSQSLFDPNNMKGSGIPSISLRYEQFEISMVMCNTYYINRQENHDIAINEVCIIINLI